MLSFTVLYGITKKGLKKVWGKSKEKARFGIAKVTVINLEPSGG